ncbi:DUF4168 domain-containing protein [Cytophagaceae bacterium ABcell3]|nr:DUF4168 domain-containing protein [Cytophagaceae bacterium ABcell3]
MILSLLKFKGRKNILTLCAALLFSSAAMAQLPDQPPAQEQEVKDDFSDAELEKFINVYQQTTEIQQKNQEVMIAAIEKQDLDVNRFNEILTAQQQQQEVELSDEEKNSFDVAVKEVMQVQQETQKEVNDVIEKEIGMDTYQQIAMAYQQSPAVKEKLDTLMEGLN